MIPTARREGVGCTTVTDLQRKTSHTTPSNNKKLNKGFFFFSVFYEFSEQKMSLLDM